MMWLLFLSFLPSALTQDTICSPNENNEFIFSVNFHSGGLLGEFQVEGCNGSSPELGMRRGETYTLVQEDVTNWMHPLGLAYYPDGAHGYKHFQEVPEFEVPTPELCQSNEFLCDPGRGLKQAPLYGIDGEFESLDDWNNGVTGGLDVYEPAFKVPQEQWKEHKYSVKITIPKESKTKQFFYFCHIHSGMSGKVTILDPASDANELVQKFDPNSYYPKLSEFDAMCGTSQVSKYHHNKTRYCPGQEFLCEKDDNPLFSQCMEAIDCKMNFEMRVEENKNPLVVFMHQMIPHHQNAVNMARIALKHADNHFGFQDEHLDVPGLLRDIINTQNMQIQEMENWLKRYGSENPKYCLTPHVEPNSALGFTSSQHLFHIICGIIFYFCFI